MNLKVYDLERHIIYLNRNVKLRQQHTLPDDVLQNDSVDLFDLIDNVPWSSLSTPKVGFQPQWFWFIGRVPLNPLYRQRGGLVQPHHPMYKGKSQLLLFFSRKSIYRILLRPQQKSTYHMQRFKQCEIRYIYQESDISQYTRFNVARILLIAWGHSDFSPPDLVTILHSCCGQSCGQCSGKRLWAVFWAEKHFFI